MTYGKYVDATKSEILPYIEQKIEEDPNGIVCMRTEEMARAMGSYFIGLTHTAILWGLRYTFSSSGIFVGTARDKQGNKLLKFRKLSGIDNVLPDSLKRR